VGGPIALLWGGFVLGNIFSTLRLPKPHFAFARKSPSQNKLDRDRHCPLAKLCLGNDTVKGTDFWCGQTHTHTHISLIIQGS